MESARRRPAMGDTVVLNPGLGVGHLVPMVELARPFLRGGLAVTVIVNVPPGKATDTSAAVARAAAANPSVRFHVLPTPPDADADAVAPDAAEAPNPFVLLRRMNAPLRDYLRSVLPSVRALVLDMFCFCADAVDVAADLGVPVYVFYTGSASSLAVNLYLPRMQAQIGDASLGEIGDAPLSFPGNRPFKPTDLPGLALDRHNEVYKSFLHAFQRIPESRGIVINRFEWLEGRALRALRDGACVPGRATPPVYCVGPMISAGGGGGGGEEKKHECLAWLDAQPEKSVVFLCFGSMGTFPKTQLEEIAVGMERSGQRFLWVVQSPRSADGGPDLLADALAEPDLAALLPEGFLERTGGRGLVVKSWAPQADVLRHRATGAFVTHCGWNSTLEAIVAGQPLICWPLYAEQRQNKVFVVEEMGAGVEMAGYDGEVVAAAEVEAKVRWVMESKGGEALRERAMAAKEKALEALQEGGASRTAFAEFLRDL
ncbi:hypothetical protein VPH35_004204 [Triticum aestivum]|nr:anthocyanidin 5,3-O-glucosyltransferase-like [Triticum aestivum]